MATFKILGQSAPSATTNTTLYTVPSSESCIVSTLVVCNRASSSTTYRIAISSTGTPSDSEYIVFDDSISGNKSTFHKLGITLEENKNIVVYSGSASVSFSAFGSEIP